MSQDFPSRSTPVLVVTTVTLAIASIFTAARLFTRFVIVCRSTIDDYFMILAWFVAFGLSFSIDYGTSKGLGRHDADIPDSWFPALRRAEYAFSVLYNVALMATKTSILVFYLRLSQNTNKLLRIASYTTLAVVNIAGIVLTFLNVFQCAPVNAVFSPKTEGARCISIVTLYLASAPVNIITDLAILVLPLPVLTSMRLPQRQKTILIFTFALGIFVVIVDVVRIYYLQQSVEDVAIGNVPDTKIGSQHDFSWYASLALMWSAVEVNVGIICANIPTLKPLMRKIMPSIISGHGDSTEMPGSFASQTPLGFNREVTVRLGSVVGDEAVRPLPPAQIGGDPEREMDMMNFLTTPGDNPIGRMQTARTAATENTVYFGFVNMRRPKSMLKVSHVDSLKYCALVTTLFFLWGFSYGLLNTLNSEIAKLARNTRSQTLGLEVAYFSAYFAGPLTIGQWVLRKGGFKATFITGLSIYGVGTLMFWPSAVLTSYTGFVISNFVVGFGLSVTETAANPFLALCGPERYSEVRLLMAQGVQAVGSVASQVLAEKAFFSDVVASPSLIDVQWTYLAVALFTVMLSLFFYYMPLPEVTDEELERQNEDLDIDRSRTHFSSLPVVYTTLGLAVLAQFLYVGAQQGVSYFFSPLLQDLSESRNSPLATSTDNFVTIGLATFASGRFLAAAACLIVKPRVVLLFLFVAALFFSALTMGLNGSPNTIAGPALMIFFFEGPLFPLIFAIGLRGLGKYTKIGAACLTTAVSGGAVFPGVMYAAQQTSGLSVQSSIAVVVALYGAGTFFPIYLNASSAARRQVDPRRRNEDERPLTPIRKLSRQVQNMVNKVGHWQSDGSELPVVEHRERNWTDKD